MKTPTYTPPTAAESRAQWVAWVANYGADKFYDAFLRNAQGARSECVHCGDYIFLDIVEGGGVPDWRTRDGDYGCNRSPESDDEGCGGHEPVTG